MNDMQVAVHMHLDECKVLHVKQC